MRCAGLNGLSGPSETRASRLRGNDRNSAWLNWVAVTGKADLIGPDDQQHNFDTEKLRLLLREIYIAAGGQHDDFDEYDREMVRSQRAAVLVAPTRIIGNHPSK